MPILSNGQSYATQWDRGLYYTTSDEDGTIVRMSNEYSSAALVVAAKDGVYSIPQCLLTSGRSLVITPLYTDSSTTQSGIAPATEDDSNVYALGSEIITVKPAPKPDDYVYTEEEQRFYDRLHAEIDDINDDIDDINDEIDDINETISRGFSDDLMGYYKWFPKKIFDASSINVPDGYTLRDALFYDGNDPSMCWILFVKSSDGSSILKRITNIYNVSSSYTLNSIEIESGLYPVSIVYLNSSVVLVCKDKTVIAFDSEYSTYSTSTWSIPTQDEIKSVCHRGFYIYALAGSTVYKANYEGGSFGDFSICFKMYASDNKNIKHKWNLSSFNMSGVDLSGNIMYISITGVENVTGNHIPIIMWCDIECITNYAAASNDIYFDSFGFKNVNDTDVISIKFHDEPYVALICNNAILSCQYQEDPPTQKIVDYISRHIDIDIGDSLPVIEGTDIGIVASELSNLSKKVGIVTKLTGSYRDDSNDDVQANEPMQIVSYYRIEEDGTGYGFGAYGILCMGSGHIYYQYYNAPSYDSVFHRKTLLSASDVGALPDSTVIPSAYDDTEVRGLISAKYSKPTAGIPKTDLSSEVQTSLGNADTALQSLPSHTHEQSDITGLSTALAGKYTKPSAGIPRVHLAPDVQLSLSKADNSLLNLGGIEDIEGFITAVATLTEQSSCTAITAGLGFTYYEPDYYGELQPVQADEMNQLVSYDYFVDEDDNVFEGIRLHSNGRFYYIDQENAIIRRLPTDYVTIEQGSSNGGKFLAVGQRGQVELVDAPSGGESWELLKDVTLTEATRKVDTGVKLTDYKRIMVSVNTVQDTAQTTTHWQWSPKGLTDGKTILFGSAFHNTQRRVHCLYLEHLTANWYRMFMQFSAAVNITDLANTSQATWGTTKEQGIFLASNGTGNICFMPYNFASDATLLAANTHYAVWGVRA